MNPRRYRAWAFVHPDFAAQAAGSGLELSDTGGIAMVDEDASIRQAILLLLTTAPGERVMRPDYGCALHRLLFSPNDDTTAGLAKHFVQKALDQWEPRIEILHLDADASPQAPEQLLIQLEYRVHATQAIQRLGLTLHLAAD